MTIILCILAWLLCGFAGSTALFFWGFGYGGPQFYDDRSVTLCQALCRSLLGPINLYLLIMATVVNCIMLCNVSIRNIKGCNKVLFKRK